MEAFDGLQAWLETEAQLQRVLQALGSLLDHLPALARAADSANFTPEADLRGEPARIPASASEACHVKQVLEAERLAAYLGPLMNQLGQAAAQVERAAGGLQEGRERSSSEVALACRSLLGMLSQELWRKQALVARATAALGPLVLHLAAGGYGLDAVEVAAAAVQEVARAWPLDGSASFVDVTLVRDMVASPSVGLGPPRRALLLQALADL